MIPDSRLPIHIGISFVITPKPRISGQTSLKFQQSLMEQGIEFANVASQEHEIAIERQAPTPLLIRVLAVQGPPIGQLIVISPKPESGPELFAKEAEAIVAAFQSTWSTQRQIVSSDVTFRDLYEASAKHAFQELWEELLGQPEDPLKTLGWSIQGGGIRFVVPPRLDDPEPVEIQLRIESYLQDPKKIWVETIFKWIQPMPPGTPLDPNSRLSQVDEYIDQAVIPFIMRRA